MKLIIKLQKYKENNQLGNIKIESNSKYYQKL